MEQITITKQRIIADLSRSAHSKLDEYAPITRAAVQHEPEFLAHLIAWNERVGQVRDSKVALPVVSLMKGFAFAENSLAHLALRDPRNLVRAVKFARAMLVDQGRSKEIRRVIERYLRSREDHFPQWTRAALQHRASMKSLYALYHVKPSPLAHAILFQGYKPPGSVFEAVAQLKDMPALEAAGTIAKHRIPYLIAVSAVGARLKDPAFKTDITMALIDTMSPSELVTNTKMLEGLGIKTNPALRAAFEAGLKRVAGSTANVLKTTRAAEVMDDEGLKTKLVQTQEKQLKVLGGIDGDWLVLGDKSGSMQAAIEASRVIAGTLAKMVTGHVWLVFYDSTPRLIEVTGKSYEEIKAATALIQAGGGTSIGCGVQHALDRALDVSGIAIIGDGGDHVAPPFAVTYQKLCRVLDRSVPVYFYQLKGTDPDFLTPSMAAAKLDMQVFDLRGGEVDFYSLPNLVQTMRASRYSLVQEILDTPLLTLNEVFKTKEAA